MKTDLHNYDIFPKVVPMGKEVEICIKPLGDHADFAGKGSIKVCVRPFNEGVPDHYPERANYFEYAPVFDENGVLHFRHTFNGEQEHFVRVFTGEHDRDGRLLQLSVYSVAEDLVGRYPFMGDLHMHTFRSDGRQSPAVVAANYRKHGYDFLAITDHRRYYPSLEAIKAFKDVPTEYTLIPGEEVHLPRVGKDFNDVHIVNFGGNYSVNALVDTCPHNKEVGTAKELRSYNGAECPDILSEEEFDSEVNDLAKTLDIPADVEKFPYACCVWIFNHIKKAGGLGIFAHPYWISNVLQVPETLTDLLLERHPFDAFEVLGGERNYEQNGFQTQKYYEDRAKGRNYPIVGSTDSHSSINNENAYVASTIVFARENTREEIVDSVKKFYSVAIDGISKEFRVVGDLRLSRYASFLLQNFFPLHDDLCYEEGRLMKDYACGDKDAADVLKAINGRMKKQREKYFLF